MNKILNPKKMIRDDVKCPTKEELFEAKKLICSVLSDCRYQIKKYLGDKELPNYGCFIAVSCDTIFDNLLAICHLGSNYMNQIFTLSRNYQEIVIDNFWLYSYFQKNPLAAEEISERFFVFFERNKADHLEDIIKMLNNDIFFRNLSREKIQQKIEETEKSISGYQFWGDRTFQKNNWRGHPKYFTQRKQIAWQERTKIAGECAQNSVNFKKAPFSENLRKLSAYTHLDPMQVNDIPAKDKNLLFCRTLNILLGLAIDLLNIQYQIRSIRKNRPQNFVRAANLIDYPSE